MSPSDYCKENKNGVDAAQPTEADTVEPLSHKMKGKKKNAIPSRQFRISVSHLARLKIAGPNALSNSNKHLTADRPHCQRRDDKGETGSRFVHLTRWM